VDTKRSVSVIEEVRRRRWPLAEKRLVNGVSVEFVGGDLERRKRPACGAVKAVAFG
jgi:hypothetical protein